MWARAPRSCGSAKYVDGEILALRGAESAHPRIFSLRIVSASAARAKLLAPTLARLRLRASRPWPEAPPRLPFAGRSRSSTPRRIGCIARRIQCVAQTLFFAAGRNRQEVRCSYPGGTAFPGGDKEKQPCSPGWRIWRALLSPLRRESLMKWIVLPVGGNAAKISCKSFVEISCRVEDGQQVFCPEDFDHWRIASATLCPIAAVVRTLSPARARSLVRAPADNTVATAASTQAASVSNLNE